MFTPNTAYHLSVLLFNHTVYDTAVMRDGPRWYVIEHTKIKIDRRMATALRSVGSLSGTVAGERSHNTILLL